MVEQQRGTDRVGRGTKRFLSPSQKYEIWLQLVRGKVTIAEAATGPLAALAASKPGVPGWERDYELELPKAEVAGLSEALKEMAVKLTLVEGRGLWG